MKVKELFSDASKWTTDWFSKDKDGELVDVNSPEACSFCLMGAIGKCYGDETPEENAVYLKLNDELLKRRYYLGVAKWNDAHTFEEVKALVEKLDI